MIFIGLKEFRAETVNVTHELFARDTRSCLTKLLVFVFFCRLPFFFLRVPSAERRRSLALAC